jgi:hypothetical protein
VIVAVRRRDNKRDHHKPAGPNSRCPGQAHPRNWFTQLTKFGFPRRFPIVQFPNVPLIAAFVAGLAARVVHGAPHLYLVSIGYLAMTAWAYEELIHGVNWFRRLLGLAFAVVLVIRVAHALHD